jgi:L-asparaginase
MSKKPRIAHFAGPNATIQNTPPLVTSNKARAKYGLPPVTNPDGSPARFDPLRPQRLAKPVKVYIEQHSAHPLETDAGELYGPPDGYLDSQGNFSPTRRTPEDKPVYEVELSPDDGVYPLPYMARQADGRAWEDDTAEPLGQPERARQPFFPDGSRSFEEIDRLAVGEHGEGNLISAKADVDFYRILPPAGYKKGLSAAQRTDVGDGDIPPEVRGRNYFYYRPYHTSISPPRPSLARIANSVRKVLASGEYEGGVWTQGSPRIEETMYWFNITLDTHLPIAGCAAQRTHGMISNDGPKNIVDCVDYVASRVWADDSGRNRAGMVLIQEQQIFAAREVQKGDARPGGYVTTGGHGGILGAVGHHGAPVLKYLPATRHTHLSDVSIGKLPAQVQGVLRDDDRLRQVAVTIKSGAGELIETVIPKIAIVKDGNYLDDDFGEDIEGEVDLHALQAQMLSKAPLSGFIIEGLSPYGYASSARRNRMMLRAVHCGMPVVRTGRGNAEGFAAPGDRFIGGGNLTSTKARLLLMACMMKFGALPPCADPDKPTPAELDAIREKLKSYQAVFDTH